MLESYIAEIELSIIIVSWNVREYLKYCLDSIFSTLSDISTEVIVVDNNSSDGSNDFVKIAYPQVKLLRNSANLGFAKANNIGIKQSQGKFILLLNPDVKLPEKSISRMLNYIKKNPGVGAVGPRLMFPDGSEQAIRYSHPNFVTEILNTFNLERSVRKLFFGINLKKEQQVKWLSGCRLLTSREVIAEVGGLDEEFFLFSEEMDWCYRMRKAGWKISWLRECEIIHYSSRSTRQNIYKTILNRYYSRELFLKKHFGVLRRHSINLILFISLFPKSCIRLVQILSLFVCNRLGKKTNEDVKTDLACRIRAYLKLMTIYLRYANRKQLFEAALGS